MAPHADIDVGSSLHVPLTPDARSSTPVGISGMNGFFDGLPRDYAQLSHRNLGYGSQNGTQTPRSHVSEGLNIIIPMGGIGSRFQKEGYRFPKPLIKIVGTPMLCWIVERLSVNAQDTIRPSINEEVENEFQIGQLMRKWCPKIDTRVIKLNYLTRGATETLFIVSQSMPASHRRRRTISLDCDTIYFADILTKVRELPPTHGGCVYFEDTGTQPIFSYLQIDDQSVITDIQEKKAISTHANTGAYIFPTANALQQWANVVLDSKLEPNNDKIGEYYTSQLIELMIKAGQVPFTAVPIRNDDFSCVGTPRQLDEFLVKISATDSIIKPKKQRFCFDLDMTLVGMPEIAGDYSTCPPLWNNIELVQALHKAGHYVIIQTARRMRTHNGNVGAVIADIGAVTIASLAKYDIPYHELVFGKPYAHIYVDDLAVNANLDTRREIGWLAADAVVAEQNSLAELKHAKKAGIVPSRDFNYVQIVGERVMKSSKSSKLLAEMYFYAHIPEGISDLFPRLHSASFYRETSTYSFTMQKLQGVSYSHLVTARSLTTGRLNAMLRALRKVHASPPSTNTMPVSSEIADMFKARAAKTPNDVDIYANYAKKLKSRYEENRNLYRQLGDQVTSRIYQTLLARLEAYEADNSAIPAAVIHGDPVFSNVILDEVERRVCFFDVRCQQGEVLTMAGDVCYDLAKVLQSLQGYDHVVLSDEETLKKAASSGKGLATIIKPEDRTLLLAMQDVFWQFVHKEYNGMVDFHSLLSLTASLLFSLIPLHRPVVQPIFLQMCVNILEHDTACPL